MHVEHAVGTKNDLPVTEQPLVTREEGREVAVDIGALSGWAEFSSLAGTQSAFLATMDDG